MTADKDNYKDFLDISPNQDRGILKKIVRKGTDDVKPCHKDTVYVHYVGTYLGGDEDGKKFDSSRDRNEQFKFTLGTSEVIKAWDIGVATMEVGEMCELIVAPEYGYNDEKTMKFEIEFFSSEGEDVSINKDGSVRKSILTAGEGLANPSVTAEVTISFSSKHKPEQTYTYVVGDPDLTKLPSEIDVAVRSMLMKETARICIKKPQVLEGDSDNFNLYQVTVNSFEKIKRISSIESFEEQMKYTNELKERANKYLKAEKYLVAIEAYKRIDEDLIYLVTNGPVEKKILDEARVAVYNNCALAYIKLYDHDNSISSLNKALEIDFKNEKALFRMGQAELLANDHEEALSYFKKCLHYYPENKAALCQLKYCESCINKAKLEEKKRFRGIFNKCKDTGLGVVELNNNEENENGIQDDVEDMTQEDSVDA